MTSSGEEKDSPQIEWRNRAGRYRKGHSNAEVSSIPVSAKSLAVIPVIFSGDNVTRKVWSFRDLCEQT
ncbi:hypothetical protein GB937_000034 [Aspergillus fischeri]|nr:hypothetical protein GB937_000034 [Aspergillus fischeri]